MNTLTCAELSAYPGMTFTEQVRSHHDEKSGAGAADAPRSGPAPGSAAHAPRLPRAKGIHGALPLGRRIDLRRFTGRDRLDKVANYLRAHVPRTEAWGEEYLRELAARIVATTEVIE